VAETAAPEVLEEVAAQGAPATVVRTTRSAARVVQEAAAGTEEMAVPAGTAAT
jgi:hypothetical protein